MSLGHACGLAAGMFLLAGCAGTMKGDQLFRMVERTSNGELREYPNASVVDVDINSSIDIKLRRESFPSAVPDEKLKRLLEQMDELARLQAELTQVGQSAVRLAQLVEQKRGQSKRLTPEESQQLTDSFKRLEEFQKRELAYSQRSVLQGGPGVRLGGLDITVDQRYLASEYSRLLSMSQQYAYKLELVAWKGTEQLHVEGYDAIPTGPPIISDKTRFVFDSKFVAEYDAAKRLAAAAADSNSVREQALQLLTARLREIQNEVSQLITQAGTAQDEISKLGTLTPEQKSAVDFAQKAITSCGDLGTEVKKAVDVVQAPSSNAAEALQLIVGRLYEVRSTAPACLQALKAALAAPAIPNELKSILEKIEPLGQAIASVLKVTEPASQPPLETSPMMLASARDTSVSLLNVNREENDVVAIRARILAGNAVVAESTRHARIRSQGFVADTGAVVLWARELNPEGHRSPFSPSAGVYAVIRFKGARKDCSNRAASVNGVPGECLEADAGSPFFHVFAPGIGVAVVVIPKLGSGSTDVAWMATGHLFGDVLQTNIGMTTGGTPVWGIGIGLHRIAGIGTYIQ